MKQFLIRLLNAIIKKLKSAPDKLSQKDYDDIKKELLDSCEMVDIEELRSSSNKIDKANYIQVVRQTWEERVKMYMKCSKKELATMMAERDKYMSPDACMEFAPKSYTANCNGVFISTEE